MSEVHRAARWDPNVNTSLLLCGINYWIQYIILQGEIKKRCFIRYWIFQNGWNIYSRIRFGLVNSTNTYLKKLLTLSI